jgi:hypothetical protein
MSELPLGWTDVTEKIPNVRPEDYRDREFGYVDISANATPLIASLR